MSDRGFDVRPEWGEAGNPWWFGAVLEPDQGHEDMRGRLAIPYLVPNGGPVGMKFRCVQPHDCSDLGHAKYLSQPGMGQRLFNVAALRTESPTVAITEGEFDAIVATEAGIPAVAVPGVNGWHASWQFLFEGFTTVLIFGDGDEPGRRFANRLAEEIHGARAVHMPTDHDVSSYAAAHGADALRAKAGL